MNYLKKQINDSKKRLDNLPNWLRKQCRFEGTDNRMFVYKKSVCQAAAILKDQE